MARGPMTIPWSADVAERDRGLFSTVACPLRDGTGGAQGRRFRHFSSPIRVHAKSKRPTSREVHGVERSGLEPGPGHDAAFFKIRS